MKEFSNTIKITFLKHLKVFILVTVIFFIICAGFSIYKYLRPFNSDFVSEAENIKNLISPASVLLQDLAFSLFIGLFSGLVGLFMANFKNSLKQSQI